MSTYVIAFRKYDDKWNAMMQLKLMCEKNKVSYPKEVEEYFGLEHVAYSEEEIRYSKMRIETRNTNWCREYRKDASEGFEIKVSDIPKEVDVIRFCNSY